MTTNAIIPTIVGDWVNLHTGAGLVAAVALTIQIVEQSGINVAIVDSILKPTGDADTAGVILTSGDLPIINSNPSAGEFTWARLRNDRGSAVVNISVQD